MIYVLPIFILIIIIIGFVKGVPCFDSFVKGARDGGLTIVKLVPSLIGLIVAVNVFRVSGILEIILGYISPFIEGIGVNKDIFPLVLIRPISGSASLATLRQIMENCGANSYASRVACVMMGSTETIFYTMAVYTEKNKIKKLPRVLPAALAANLISAIAAGIICRFL